MLPRRIQRQRFHPTHRGHRQVRIEMREQIATAARMKHARYRNYFPAARNDLFAGLRCVSLV